MPRPVRRLNNTEVEKAKPKDKPYTLTDGDGLFLLVMPSGSKTWQFNYYRPITKKRVKFSLGAYPSITIAQARAIREGYRALLANGVDPQIHKQEQLKQEEESADTFFKIAELWKEKRSKQVEPMTMKKNWARLENHLFPAIAHYPVDKVTSPLLIEAVKPLDDIDNNDTLHRILNLANQILNYAVTVGMLPFNSCYKAGDAYYKKPKEHHPAIHYKNLPKLLSDFEYSNRDLMTKILFRWQLLSMLRPAEAVSAEWSEIDFKKKLWFIPALKMKKVRSGQFPHTVPLSTQMLDILEVLKPLTGDYKFIFPHYSNPNKSMSSETITNALREIGYKGRQDSHGLRSVARTYLEDKGQDFNLSEACLAHKIGDESSRSYIHTQRVELRRPIMQLWGDYVEACSPKP